MHKNGGDIPSLVYSNHFGVTHYSTSLENIEITIKFGIKLCAIALRITWIQYENDASSIFEENDIFLLLKIQ